MCGICGFVDDSPIAKKKRIIKQMNDRLVHRGPDGEGLFYDDFVALGHRRLAILDVNGGKEPLYNEENTLVLVFNGEIYNYQALQKELEKLGYHFKTKTDAEVILHGYEAWGRCVVKHLRGMFAFVIYDKVNNCLFGARDPFGIKPFYYYNDQKIFMFASEIKAMLEHPKMQKELNIDALKMYLIFQYSVKEETFFKHVYKLKPGHYFYYQDQKMTIKPYYKITFDRKITKNLKETLKASLEESINLHQTTSDVGVGAYLSGGVDSSYVVATSNVTKTFSVGFSYDGFDETTYAKKLSEQLNMEHFDWKISPDDFFDTLPIIQYYTDEPHANLSTVPLFFLSKLTKEHVKVVLSGEGADEFFGGYHEYADPFLLKLYLHLPLWFRKKIRTICLHLPPFKGRNTLLKAGLPFLKRYIGHGTLFEEKEVNKILAEPLRNEETIEDILNPYYEEVKNKSEITKKMFLDFHFWLPQDILLKADKMSMANSIELRTPLLDQEVFKVAKTIPESLLVKGVKTKVLFRRIAYDVLPKEWANRRKCGFPVPFSKWLREEKYFNRVKKIFEMEDAKKFFDVPYIKSLLYNHYKGIENNGRKIYNIYCFLIWYQVYFGQNQANS